MAAEEIPGAHDVDETSGGHVCMLCGRGGRTGVAAFHMTHGVTVWLCEPHRAPRFLRRREGRDFAERVAQAWRAGGALNARRGRVLAAHRRRMRPPARPDLPGSYSWPELRALAERRFAAGENPRVVIAELRDWFEGAPARVPSVRTMRRWYADGRWHAGRPTRPRETVLGIRRPRRSDWEGIIPFDNWVIWGLWPLNGWWIDDRPPRRRGVRRR